MLSFLKLVLSLQLEPAVPFMQTAPLEGGSWMSTASSSTSARQEHHGPQIPPKKADLIPHLWALATLSSELTEASQAGPRPSQVVFLSRASMTTHLSSEDPSPLWPSWPSDGPRMLLGSEPSVPLTEVPRVMMTEKNPAQPSGSPFPLEQLSRETVKSTESVDPTPREPAHISKEFPPLTRPFRSRLDEEGLIFYRAPRRSQEILPIIKVEEPLQNEQDPSGEGVRGYLDLSTSEPSQGTEELGLIVLPGTDVIFTTRRERQPDASPELPERHSVGPADPQTVLPRDLLTATSEKPATPSESADRTLKHESAPTCPETWPPTHSQPPTSTYPKPSGSPRKQIALLQ